MAQAGLNKGKARRVVDVLTLGAALLSVCFIVAFFHSFSGRASSLDQAGNAMVAQLESQPVFVPVPSFNPLREVLWSRDYLVADALLSWKGDHALGRERADLSGELEQYGAEFKCLTQAVYYEARGESSSGRIAVADVVLNRVSDRTYPNSVCDVVFQGALGKGAGCQFSFTCDGSILRSGREELAWSQAKGIAAYALMGLSAGITKDATHYHANYVNPVWASRLDQTIEIGNHIFYRRAS